MTMRDEYISVKEAALLLGLSIRTIRRYVKRGILPYKRFPDTSSGRLFINKLDIPAFARKS